MGNRDLWWMETIPSVILRTSGLMLTRNTTGSWLVVPRVSVWWLGPVPGSPGTISTCCRLTGVNPSLYRHQVKMQTRLLPWKPAGTLPSASLPLIFFIRHGKLGDGLKQEHGFCAAERSPWPRSQRGRNRKRPPCVLSCDLIPVEQTGKSWSR